MPERLNGVFNSFSKFRCKINGRSEIMCSFVPDLYLTVGILKINQISYA